MFESVVEVLVTMLLIGGDGGGVGGETGGAGGGLGGVGGGGTYSFLKGFMIL